MLGGRTFCGIVKDTLILRFGLDGADRALKRPHAAGGLHLAPMKGMVFVEPFGQADCRDPPRQSPEPGWRSVGRWVRKILAGMSRTGRPG